MLSSLKNKRKAWLTAGLSGAIQPIEIPLEEIRKKQMLIDRTEKVQKIFWRTVPNSLGISGFQKDEMINLETYRDDYQDETEVIVFPKNKSKQQSPVVIQGTEDSSDINSSQVLILHESSHQHSSENTNVQKAQITSVADPKIKVKAADDQSERVLEEKTDQPAIIQNEKGNVKDHIQSRLQEIINKQSNERVAENQILSVQVNEIPVAAHVQRKEPSVIMEVEVEPVVREDESELQWQTIRKKEEIPSSYQQDWKFKGTEELVLDKEKPYTTPDIFQKLFTEDMNSYILSCVFQKTARRNRNKKNGQIEEEKPFNITSYEIDALIALVLYFKCIRMPNKLNLIVNEQQLVEKELFEKLILNFSIGMKDGKRVVVAGSSIEDEKVNRMTCEKVKGFVDLLNGNFKKLFHPSETLVSSLSRFEGMSLSKEKSDFALCENLLTESTQSYILDVKFERKELLKSSQDVVVSTTQIDQFDYYKHKNHKIILIDSESISVKQIESMKQLGIGVIAACPINEMKFSNVQVDRIKKLVEVSKTSAVFASSAGGKVLSVITKKSNAIQRAYISNCDSILSDKEFRHPRMEPVFIKSELERRDSKVSGKYLSGVKWDWLVFLRALDAILTNCTTLMVHLNQSANKKINRATVVSEIIDFLITRYKGHCVLQQKICASQITHTKDIRIHFSKELPAGSKKIECIVCGAKTRSYCVQCTETKRTQIGFCGSHGCLEKHNDLPAKLLQEQNQMLASAHQAQRRKKLTTYDRPYESCSESSAKERTNISSLRGNQTNTTFKFGAAASERKSLLYQSTNHDNLTKSLRTDGYSSESQTTSFRYRQTQAAPALSSGSLSDSNNSKLVDEYPNKNKENTFRFGNAKETEKENSSEGQFQKVGQSSTINSSKSNLSLLLNKSAEHAEDTSESNNGLSSSGKSTSKLALEFSRARGSDRGSTTPSSGAYFGNRTHKQLQQDLSVVSESSLVAEQSIVMNKDSESSKKAANLSGSSLVSATPIFGNISSSAPAGASLAVSACASANEGFGTPQSSRLFAPRSANVGQAIESDQRLVGKSPIRKSNESAEEVKDQHEDGVMSLEKERKRATKIPWYNTKDSEAADKLEKERSVRNQNEMMSNPRVQSVTSFAQPALRIKNSKPTGNFRFESEEGQELADHDSTTKSTFKFISKPFEQKEVKDEQTNGNSNEKRQVFKTKIGSTLAANGDKQGFNKLASVAMNGKNQAGKLHSKESADAKMEEFEEINSSIQNLGSTEMQENNDDHLNDSEMVARRQIIKSYFNKK